LNPQKQFFSLKTAVVDIGNTNTKVAFFRERNLERIVSLDNFSSSFISALNEFKPDKIFIASVKHFEGTLISKFAPYSVVALGSPETLKINGLNILYGSANTLGIDRLANAMALYQFHPGVNSLSIDVGTCIKYDFVTESGAYLGGAISPGLKMRYKSLHHFTDKLPLIEPSDKFPNLIGTSTYESINAGVMLGIKAEIEQIIHYYEAQYNKLNVVLTGGDAHYFAKQLKSSIFADNFLTLKGINELGLLQIL
jgi:type III pantothenate kinase